MQQPQRSGKLLLSFGRVSNVLSSELLKHPESQASVRVAGLIGNDLTRAAFRLAKDEIRVLETQVNPQDLSVALDILADILRIAAIESRGGHPSE